MPVVVGENEFRVDGVRLVLQVLEAPHGRGVGIGFTRPGIPFVSAFLVFFCGHSIAALWFMHPDDDAFDRAHPPSHGEFNAKKVRCAPNADRAQLT